MSKIRDFILGVPISRLKGVKQVVVKRTGATETVSLLSREPQARRAVTEAKGQVPAPAQSIGEFVRSGGGGGSSTSWPIPRLAAEAATFVPANFSALPLGPRSPLRFRRT